ncbi:MAG: hypothetical protein K5872_14630 [Rhizobiaceae bacterium]|nr:hypothetical protein [Rhizobiaceae bacterium]MCV0407457.1 hypothetical protein [Rhizobiaceae bacterium]
MIAGTGLLRAAMAVAFIILSAAQPGLFAMADASGMHDGAVVEKTARHHAAVGHEHHDGHVAGTGNAFVDHHGMPKANDKSCEMHCAPALAVPVDCPPLPRTANGHVEPRCEASVLYGMNHEVIKPPRT